MGLLTPKARREELANEENEVLQAANEAQRGGLLDLGRTLRAIYRLHVNFVLENITNVNVTLTGNLTFPPFSPYQIIFTAVSGTTSADVIGGTVA